ncbi:hypothetical protein BFL28_05585 [Sphingomonas turrisvirgatae]|uniref:Right handed beta helix domain-containing protein n=1 Tax=Sphingomonas turrisvirgatae TaxID=1888892 RepID=A0A1E3LRS4_9SPHN|nr:hypothetical protein BFL28_05585 [Sphingomonas turrisvirgatae]
MAASAVALGLATFGLTMVVSRSFAVAGELGAGGREAVVGDAAQLTAALRAATPGRAILLKPGTYAPVALRGITPAGMVTVRSLDPAKPAILNGINLRDSGNLTFSDLVFQSSGSPKQDAFLFNGTRNLRFERLKVTGQDGPDGYLDKSMFIRNSQQIAITNNEFTHAWIALSLLDTQQVSVTSNYFHGLRMDGVRGGGNSDIEIAYNVLADFKTALPDHPDGIQFWTTRQNAAASNIRIVGNVIMRGQQGAAVQGIFMNDEAKNLPYRNVTIADNLVIGGMFHGINLAHATGAVLSGNTVVAFPDQKSWIRANGSDIDLKNNRAPIFVLNNARLKRVGNGNAITQMANDGGRRALVSWASGRDLARYHASARPLLRRQ